MKVIVKEMTKRVEIEIGDLLIINNQHSGKSARLIIRDVYRNKILSVDLRDNQVAFEFDTLEQLYDFYYNEAEEITVIKSKNIEVIAGV